VTPAELAPRFFVAVVVVVVVCRVVARVLGRLGQPAVVGEMLAGVLLGPSLLGQVLPGVQAAIFPEELLPVLYVLGQVGLVLFMVAAGHEFGRYQPGRSVRTAGAVSMAGICAPLVLGAAVTVLARDRVPVFVEGVSTGVAAAFVGVALAITAFPMLARIVVERGQAGTAHGGLALAAGALDDAVAWILLAFVLAAASGDLGPALLTLFGAVLFAVLTWVGGPRVVGLVVERTRFDPVARLTVVLTIVFAVAWYTDTIGLYAVFGAFCVGLVMPQGSAGDDLVASITPLATGIFLPLFFTYSGLQTRFGLLGDPAVLLFALVCVLVAVVGKFGACWAAARLAGQPPAVAARVGALMNARGLMQLIALNVGLQAGIVSERMFTALVLVALVTTLMTTPALSLLDRFRRLPSMQTGQVSSLPAAEHG